MEEKDIISPTGMPSGQSYKFVPDKSTYRRPTKLSKSDVRKIRALWAKRPPIGQGVDDYAKEQARAFGIHWVTFKNIGSRKKRSDV